MHRRTFLLGSAAVLAGARLGALGGFAPQVPTWPRPTQSQLDWQRDELALFLHFGVNTFTDREWGDGREAPAMFAPTQLDAREWARTARAAGFRAMILTAKHHDGFCLWPTRTTRHSVVSSPWRGGQGDLVKEFTDACRAEGLRAGLYLSPWDRNNPAYGDSPRYNDLYVDQLRELLTNYGAIHEVWFDGANGEGPNGKRQQYDWPRVWGEVRRLQPNAVMFSDAGPDVRWCGNETGSAGDPNWSCVNPDVVPVPGMSGRNIIDSLQHGDPNGSVWRPAEADTSIRPGWFHHPAEDERVKSVETLVNLYVQSVGRNSKLLLNVPPTRDGVLHPTDVARLRGFAEQRRVMFAEDLAAGAKRGRGGAGGTTRGGGATNSMAGGGQEVPAVVRPPTEMLLEFDRPRTITIVRLEEAIDRGQAVRNFELSYSRGPSGPFEQIARGSTIGYARLLRFPARDVQRLSLSFETLSGRSATVRIRAFA